jgi:hypothetical protein
MSDIPVFIVISIFFFTLISLKGSKTGENCTCWKPASKPGRTERVPQGHWEHACGCKTPQLDCPHNLPWPCRSRVQVTYLNCWKQIKQSLKSVLPPALLFLHPPNHPTVYDFFPGHFKESLFFNPFQTPFLNFLTKNNVQRCNISTRKKL